jgi:hypothetical protein
VEEAVRDFLAVKKAENVSLDILSNHRIMLEDRLVPLARSKGIGYIQQTDDARCWSDFRQSWINLNPFQNRKATSGAIPERAISPNTAKRLLG